MGAPPTLTFADRLREIAGSEYAALPLDNYGQGGFLSAFEADMAEMLGKEAAVFMPSGTMAQQIALRIWCDRAGSHRIAFHPTSHLELHEQAAYRELHHLEAELVGASDRLLNIDDLRALEHLPAALLLELPQREIGGQLPSWQQLAEIASWAKKNGIKLHMDGARLWECRPHFAREYDEISSLFDSVYVSFYKILGGLPGAMLFGPTDFIAESRIWLRRHGGNLYTLAPNAIAAMLGLNRELDRIAEYCERAGEIATALAGLENLKVVPAKPPTNMMHWHFSGDRERLDTAMLEIARESGVMLFRGLREGAEPGVWVVEVSISSRSMDVSAPEIRRLMENLLERAQGQT